jgi:Cdc6-like AAA superfamily ATPase
MTPEFKKEMESFINNSEPPTLADFSDTFDDPRTEADAIVREVELEQNYINGYAQWSTADEGVFVPTSKTVPVLAPGVYEVRMSQTLGLHFVKINTRTEGLLRFPDTKTETIVNEIQKFWEREAIFKEYKITYKRGIIMYGPPGSGKSCTIRLLMDDVIARDGIVIRFDNPHIFIEGIRVLRKIQPTTPVVAIMEDIDSLLDNYSETEVLNILDGVNEVSKIVFVATTNYPDKLGDRIMNRPSRFDKRFNVGFPTMKARQMYIEHLAGGVEKAKTLNIDTEKWAKDTDKFTIAHLKELFVAVVILGDTYEEAIKSLTKMKEDVTSENGEMGFHVNDADEESDEYN